MLLVGTYVRAEGAGLAFREWPLMGESLVPDLSLPGAVAMFAHRMLAIVVVALFAWCDGPGPHDAAAIAAARAAVDGSPSSC